MCNFWQRSNFRWYRPNRHLKVVRLQYCCIPLLIYCKEIWANGTIDFYIVFIEEQFVRHLIHMMPILHKNSLRCRRNAHFCCLIICFLLYFSPFMLLKLLYYLPSLQCILIKYLHFLIYLYTFFVKVTNVKQKYFYLGFLLEEKNMVTDFLTEAVQDYRPDSKSLRLRYAFRHFRY